MNRKCANLIMDEIEKRIKEDIESVKNTRQELDLINPPCMNDDEFKNTVIKVERHIEAALILMNDTTCSKGLYMNIGNTQTMFLDALKYWEDLAKETRDKSCYTLKEGSHHE